MSYSETTVKKSAFVFFLIHLSIPCLAQSGAFEINQACVSSGCFDGDSAGFPVVANAPGVYVLTSDLTTNDATQTLINITTDNVTLDLKGFTIKGPNVCTGEGVSCENESLAGNGVTSYNRNILVIN